MDITSGHRPPAANKPEVEAGWATVYPEGGSYWAVNIHNGRGVRGVYQELGSPRRQGLSEYAALKLASEINGRLHPDASEEHEHHAQGFE
jgi:hypothetical protein